MGLFNGSGAHVLVDGQYGSTGKGALAAWLALQSVNLKYKFGGVATSAGPNSGHTFYFNKEKHVLKQLPSFAVALGVMGQPVPPVFFTAGSVINPEILQRELEKYPFISAHVHSNAAVITDEDIEREHEGSIAAVAGTRSGTGSAIANKVLRRPNAIWGSFKGRIDRAVTYTCDTFPMDLVSNRLFVEVSQGFSLGINSEFYPKVTSRECTVAQALADARIAPRDLTMVYQSMRTFPIRVGNVDGYDSGGWYFDQDETSWEALGVEPERTTVTNRVRRVATFSEQQYIDACRVNAPNWVFMNFMNYLKGDKQDSDFRARLDALRAECPYWHDFIWGYGPELGDIIV